jgi:hypothetical protein
MQLFALRFDRKIAPEQRRYQSQTSQSEQSAEK